MTKRKETKEQIIIFATEEQAKVAYQQFAKEPFPVSNYPKWEDLDAENRSLWYRVATSVLNGRTVD